MRTLYNDYFCYVCHEITNHKLEYIVYKGFEAYCLKCGKLTGYGQGIITCV